MTRWTDALKKWNAEHNPGKWCVPRKGSDGHAQVLKLMGPAPPKKGKAAAKPDAVDRADMAAAAAAPAKKGVDIRSFLGAKLAAHKSSKADHPEKPAAPEPAGKRFTIKPRKVKEVVKEAVNEVVEAPKSQRDKIIELLSTELQKKKIEPAGVKSTPPAAGGPGKEMETKMEPKPLKYNSKGAESAGGSYASLPIRVYVDSKGKPLFAVAREFNKRFNFELGDSGQEGVDEYRANGITHPGYGGEYDVIVARNAKGDINILVEKVVKTKKGESMSGSYAPRKSLELYELPPGAEPFHEEPQSEASKEAAKREAKAEAGGARAGEKMTPPAAPEPNKDSKGMEDYTLKTVSWEELGDADQIIVKRVYHEKMGPNSKGYSDTYYKMGKKNDKSAWMTRVDSKGRTYFEDPPARMARKSIPRTVLVRSV